MSSVAKRSLLEASADPLLGQLEPRPFVRVSHWIYRHSFFGGRVGLSVLPQHCGDEEQAAGDLNDPGLDEAADLLRRVLDARYREFEMRIAVVHPITDSRIPRGSLCSSSGSASAEPPGIYLTVTHAAATAEALVHEMAHHKLFALGVTTDCGGRILQDEGKVAYSAAVNRERPIPAILHAAYSFLHMVEFDVECLRLGLAEREARMLLPGNVRVARNTVDQLRRHARAGEHGADFLAKLYDWAEALFSAADAR